MQEVTLNKEQLERIYEILNSLPISELNKVQKIDKIINENVKQNGGECS